MHTLDHNRRLMDAHQERPDKPGTKEGQPCLRYPEPDGDEPRGHKPKPCDGVMVEQYEDADRHLVWTECDICGEIGD